MALMVWGFRHFYLQGKAYPDRPLSPPIRTLIVVHAVTMAAWILLFVIQSLLIVKGRRKLHMALGKIGALLAAGILVVGIKLGIEAARIMPPQMKIWNLSPRPFMAVPVVGVIVFGAFVAAGVWFRRRPEIHRPMMLMATLSAIPAAVSRIDVIINLYTGTIWETIFGPFFATIVLTALLLIIKSLLSRSLDRWFAVAFVLMTAAFAGIMQLANTGLWDQIATGLLG